jgi:hypothetical protein
MEQVREFIKSRRLASAYEKTKKDLNKTLSDFVDKNGYVGPNGHRYVDLPEPVEGFRALQRRRIETKQVDVEVAERILTEIGALEECSTRIITLDATKMDAIEEVLKEAGLWEDVATETNRIDDDKLLAYHAEHKDKLTSLHMDQILVEDVTWQFWPVEAGSE